MQWLLRNDALAQAALCVAIEHGLRGICTFQTDLSRPTELLPNLLRRLQWLELPALEYAELAEILAGRADRLHVEQSLHVEPETITTCLQLAGERAGADPGRCLTLLESAAALVAGTQPGRLGPDEVAAVRALGRAIVTPQP